MRNLIVMVLCVFVLNQLKAQDLNANVVVKEQIFQNLETKFPEIKNDFQKLRPNIRILYQDIVRLQMWKIHLRMAFLNVYTIHIW